MSVASTQISCSNCSFSASDSVTWGRFSYELDDGTRIPLQRCLGWCHHCDDVVAIEAITPISRQLTDIFGRPRKSAIQLQLDLQKAKNRLRNIFGFGKSEIARLTSDLESTVKEERENDVYNNLVESRIGSARCLRCSMRDVHPLKISRVTEGAPSVSTGFIHPECGGQILAGKSGFRVSMRFDRVRLYDCEGCFLREEPA